MKIRIVIGKNFGDEGKGLATDFFAAEAQKAAAPCLVIRHNGGAQAGHTVDLPGSRFIFHQLSSGSFRRADTLWVGTFLPDLYKLREEIADFAALAGFRPRILASPECRCVLIDDVLLNMALETARGSRRHGSCGMGINEAVERSAEPEFALNLGAVAGMDCDALAGEMARIRREYLPRRLEALGLRADDLGEYGELLQNPFVLENAAEEMCRGAEALELLSRGEALAARYGNVIFEGAQGLLLDSEYTPYAPHLTSSRTGLTNPLSLCRSWFPLEMPEAVYVSRTYVTRHGAGPLPQEGGFDPAAYGIRDLTNQPNPWQGALRFAPHGSFADFFTPMLTDSDGAAVSRTLMLTHCNETRGNILLAKGPQSVDFFLRQAMTRGLITGGYTSFSPYAEEITAFPQ